MCILKLAVAACEVEARARMCEMPFTYVVEAFGVGQHIDFHIGSKQIAIFLQLPAYACALPAEPIGNM